MKIEQLKQKIPFLIFFLSLTTGLILWGTFGSDDSFSHDVPRSLPLFMGIFGTCTSLLWFFFGRIDWSTVNAIKKTLGQEVDESESESD